ncbi:hypothetical protein CSB90_2221 [Pseudomonas aeruginosa]|nr:hypothetical protein CSB90_2221 [Pseudomonas aeruginosa]
MHAKAVVRHGLAGPFFSPGGKKGIVPGPGEGPCAASVALDERPSGAGQAGLTGGVRLTRPRHGRRSATRDHWQNAERKIVNFSDPPLYRALWLLSSAVRG